LWLILFGYYLKIFIADNLAHIVDPIYSSIHVESGIDVLVATYAFAFQIFGDFAGYSCIAIGVARLMGIRLMTNFKYPYFVTSPQDFWKNWHISLSTWLRDYLYISLGGSRGGRGKTNRNLAITMVLGGIWHGAAWNFVIWGVYQGAILIIHRELISTLIILEGFLSSSYSRKIWRTFKIFFMFHITCYGWLIFRANSFDQILVFSQLLLFNFGEITGLVIRNLLMILFYVTPLLFYQWIEKRKGDNTFIVNSSFQTQAAVILIMYFSILLFGEFGSEEFIYFQF